MSENDLSLAYCMYITITTYYFDIILFKIDYLGDYNRIIILHIKLTIENPKQLL